MAKEKKQLTTPILREKLKEYGLKLRYDVITREIDIQGGQAIGCNKHTTYDTLITLLQDKLRPEYSCTTDADIRARLKIILEENKYNSFIEKINSYPEWDESKPDRIEQLCQGLRLPEDDWLSRVLIKKWLLQTLLIADNNEERPFASQGILVLHGDQRLGKTYIARVLSFFDEKIGATGVQIDRNDKDTKIKATSHAIVELGELGRTITSANTDFIKAFLTETHDDIRRPYDRTSTKSVRRSSYIGTVNPMYGDQFLTDTTGNRRYFTIPMKQKTDHAIIDDLADNIGELWQQVKWEQQHNYKPNYERGLLGCELTDEEYKALEERNRGARVSVGAEEELRDYFEYVKACGLEYKEYAITITQLKYILSGGRHYLPDISKMSNVVIGRALGVLGYNDVRTKDSRLRVVPLLDQDVIVIAKDLITQTEAVGKIKQYK